MAYEERFYHNWMKSKDLVAFSVQHFETDLWIQASKDLTVLAQDSVQRHYNDLASYIEREPDFLHSLTPYPARGYESRIVKEMVWAASIVGVGPMAAVAGSMAQLVGEDLLAETDEVIVENGGDIFLKCAGSRKFSIYAGESSPFTGRVEFEVEVNNRALAICTSSGTVGHSLSLGKSDAVVVIAKSAALADAAATALANRIKTPADVETIIAEEKKKQRFEGVIIAFKDKLGIWGNIRIVGRKEEESCLKRA